MSREAEPFSSGVFVQGIVARTPDFTTDLQLDFDTINVTHGIQLGIGPRYGVATIPGQNDAEPVSGTRLPGLRLAEEAPISAQSMINRVKVLGIVPVVISSFSSPSTKITTYAYVITYLRAGTGVEYLDVCLTSTWDGTYENVSANIYDGEGRPATSLSTNGSIYVEGLVSLEGAAPKDDALRQYLQYISTKYYASVTPMSVSGADIPCQWIMGDVTSTGGATTSPSIAFFRDNTINWPPTPNTQDANIMGGVPSEYNLQNFRTRQRAFKVFALNLLGGLNIEYSLTARPTTTLFQADRLEAGTVNFNPSGITATKDTAGTNYAGSVSALLNDKECTTNSGYKAILIACKKAIMNIMQDSYMNYLGRFGQWLDPTENSYAPPTLASGYTEEGVSTKTCFANWSPFVRGTAMTATFANGPQLGGANTGVLRKNTVYEFAYSIYNKRLNYETNVGSPVKFQVGGDPGLPEEDFYSLVLSNISNTIYNYWYANTDAFHFMPFAFSATPATDGTTGWQSTQNFINFTEYRFYYRQEGTFEWLPALFVDAPKFWFYPGFTKLSACTGAIAATPGGQPGAFNDYSPLSKQEYTCVLNYKDRAFWFSEKAVNFSLRNNLLAYPARNSINASNGTFLGGIVHNYPGEAQQSSRLVIFGSDTTYVARFTGLPLQTQVQVSAENSATFNIDGSDLVIDPWTSVTAFSYRAAVVADGILYWWGPQGIYRDDGVATPAKISGDDMEPNIFTIYDPNKLDEIFASYDEHTKDITWYYVPRDTERFNTESIVYNTTTRQFLRGGYIGKIDWSHNLNVESNIKTAGRRSIIGARNSSAGTVQRAYFYDLRNRSGDMRPTTDFVVKQISTPATGQRRLTLATGYDASRFTSYVAGNLIALQNVTQYTNVTTSDLIAEIITSNSVAGTIDITLPSGATLADGTFTFDKYFPLYERGADSAGLNGIPWEIKTGYWMPKGVNGYYLWLYWYAMHKLNLWVSDNPMEYSLAYRTPTSVEYITDLIRLTENSDGNCQRYHPLRLGDDNIEGQAFKQALSGFHIGHEWTLQYMELFARKYSDGDPLMRFMRED